MFFTVFSTRNSIADWDFRHLWDAQVLISSCMIDDPERYRSIDDLNELREYISKETFELSAMPEWKSIFRNIAVMNCVLEHLNEYIKQEIETVSKNLSDAVEIRPIPDAIINCIKEEPLFREHISDSRDEK